MIFIYKCSPFQEKAKKVVVVGGGYIGMEVAAATSGWNLDITVSTSNLACLAEIKMFTHK